MKTSLLFLAVCLLACVWFTNAATYRFPVVKQKLYRRNQWHCEYEGLQVLPRTKILDLKKCWECVCSRSGMGCEDMVMDYSYPDDSECMDITVRCKTIWVYRKFPYRTCPEDKRPMMSAVGKK